MRRSALDRTIKKVKQVTPRWFFQRCNQCKEDVKHETLWKSEYYSRGIYYIRYKIYTCKKCAPTIIDFIELNEQCFEKNVDLNPLRKERAEMKQHNLAEYKPTRPDNKKWPSF